LRKGEGGDIPEILGLTPLSLRERGLGVREKTNTTYHNINYLKLEILAIFV